MKARRKLRESKSHAVVWVLFALVIAVGVLGYRTVTGLYSTYNSWISDLPKLSSDAIMDTPRMPTSARSE